MATRAADATIKGYYYQFDTTILKLLELATDADAIIVEGIEDIDIETATDNTTIQCKYLSKPRFINSAVREPITLMLSHFVSSTKSIDFKYVLYAHFESEIPGTEPIITLTKLKEILTYSEKKIEKHYEIENSITDAELIAFIDQFQLSFGQEFYTQQKQVINKLKAKFSCSDFEADTIYYNNALRIVIDKAIQKKVEDRKTTKNEFIKGIDCSRRLFNEWFIKLRSKKEYLKLVAQNLKSTRALEPSRSKFIFLDQNILDADNSELPLIIFVENLLNKYYKTNSSLRDAKPITIIVDCDSKRRLEIKSSLIDNGIVFNDGYEEIKFSSTVFNNEPVINKTTNGTKIIKSSYVLKILSKETFISHILNIHSPNAFLLFSKQDFLLRFPTGQSFDIKYCENLKEVHYLLIP